MAPETAHGGARPVGSLAQRQQHQLGHFEAGSVCLADDVLDPRVHERERMLAIACARKYLQVGELCFHQNRSAYGSVHIIDSKYEHRGVFSSRRSQEIQARSVPVIDFVAEPTHEIDVRLIAVQCREGDVPGAQDTGDYLAKAAEACDQDPDVLLVEIIERTLRSGHESPQHRVVQKHQQGSEHHRQGHGEDEQVGRLLSEDLLSRGEREQDESELASRGKGEAQAPRGLRLQTCDSAQ